MVKSKKEGISYAMYSVPVRHQPYNHLNTPDTLEQYVARTPQEAAKVASRVWSEEEFQSYTKRSLEYMKILLKQLMFKVDGLEADKKLSGPCHCNVEDSDAIEEVLHSSDKILNF
ncbi:Uncharacterized protein APZ42_010246 [Daphnia magna]|uniref:Uncharacterized protein n=1 Tax=Daphnia magna TaxID=35525 RepID=A0A164DHJ7_9CRUS|nr:Uncharacterized protein APZ42_010246 [Daphnia magna]